MAHRIRHIWEGIERSIRRIRRADERTKRHWLILGTILAMVVVGVLWVVYLDVTLPQIAQEPETQAVTEVTEPGPSGDSIWSVFGRGLSVIGSQINIGIKAITRIGGQLIERITGSISTAREYSIEGTNP